MVDDLARRIGAVRYERVGFSCTRKGMIIPQRVNVEKAMLFLTFDGVTAAQVFHHGCCVGADEETHHIAKALGWKVHGHPPIETEYKSGVVCDIASEPKDYLARNVDIVDASEFMLFAPSSMTPSTRGGTWYTWRYATAKGKRWMMVLPNGRLVNGEGRRD